MSVLNTKLIELIEQEILSGKLITDCNDDNLSISYKYYERAESKWKLITQEDAPIHSYHLFAENAYGMTSYGFYKAKNGKIYIIVAYIDNITQIYIPSKKCHFLQNLIDE